MLTNRTYSTVGGELSVSGNKEEKNAALAVWKADYAAREGKKTFDDGKCSTTCTFEWVVSPFIRDGKVYGASKL